MLIYCGNLDHSNIKIQKFHSEIYKISFSKGGISIFDNKSGKIQTMEDSETFLIIAEGDILNLNKISRIILLESDRKSLFRKLEGYFAFFIWDKNQKKAFIMNDKLGLNPLYYVVTAQNELIVSTRLEDLMHILNTPVEIDFIALKQYAMFNYVLGERTFIKNIHRFEPATLLIWDTKNISKDEYWNVTQSFSEKVISEKEFLNELPEIIRTVISEFINDKQKVGLLLSGGYDSRAILACLHNLGAKGYAYTWDNPAIKETDIAQRLAEATDFELRFLPFYPPEGKTEELIYEVEKITDFNFPLFHIGRYNAIKQISDEVDIVLSGQGELIRITPVPNDYISTETLTYIYHQKCCKRTEHYFQFEEEDQELFDEFEYRHLSPSEQLMCFLLYNAYRDDYGMLRYGESKIVSVAMPFFDSRIIEWLMRSPFSIARLKSWRRNVPFTLRTRKIYYEIVKQMAPHLLDIPLDRGYPQKFDNYYFNLILTSIWGLKNAINLKGKKEETPTWLKFVYALLSEFKTLNKEIYNKQKIQESLKRFPSWSPEESYELEKVARFELFYRHFIESN